MAKGLFECLHEANLGHHIEQFRLHGVKTLEKLATLTIQDYVKFGITLAEDRKRLFRLIHIVKGVQEEKRMSAFSMTMDMSMHNKENTPVRKPVNSQNKSLKDASDGSRIPSSIRIQWTPKKKDAYGDDYFVKNNESFQSGNSIAISAVQRDTLKRLEDQGGILFVDNSPYQPKLSPRNRTRNLRQSLSDSEIVDYNSPDSSPNLVDVTGFGAPKLKASVVEVIDYKEKGYNYGIPGQKVITPARKQVVNSSALNLDTSKIKVCVRKRPLLKKELKAGEKDIVGTEGQSSVVLNENKLAVDLTEFMQVHKYHFDEVFDEGCSNLEVYNKTAKLLVPYVFKRAKATCFAYGQTGAGKTHTMLGNKNTKGMYLLAAEDIFSRLAEEKAGSGLSVWVGYFEIYCGQLFDLLNCRERLHAREDSRHNVCIAGLNEIRVNGPQGLIRVVEQGNRLRSKGSSGVNADSSRSHAILQIELQDAGRRKLGRFSFIDLAGSERACDTADPNKVTRFEGAEINTSLLALKECIRALDQDHRHTPFRQSKLTQVLKDSFVGQSRTCMIATIAPGASSSEHTLNTLRYADRVKELRKQAPANQSPSTPHPSTPSTFSPGNTSTPVKHVKQPLTTRQLDSTTTLVRSKTPGGHSNNTKQSLPVKQPLITRQLSKTSTPVKSKTPQGHSENPKQSLPSWKRRGSTDKSGSKKTPTSTRKTKYVVKSNKKSPDSTPPKSIKDTKSRSDTSRRSSFGSVKDKAKIQATTSIRGQETSKRRQEISSERGKGTSFRRSEDTPSKRSQEAKVKAREAFLMNSSLPVWEPPKEMELIQKEPEVTMTKTAWEFENPKFKKTNLNSSKDESKVTLEKVAYVRPDPSGCIIESEDNVENNNNISFSGKEEFLPLVEDQNDNNLEEKQFDNSFNSDSTIELLAEIDHALRNSLVSPLFDERPRSGHQNVQTSPGSQHIDLVSRSEISNSGVNYGRNHPASTQPYKSQIRTDRSEGETHQNTPVAVVTGVKSPDASRISLQRSQSMPSQANPVHQDQIPLDMHYSRSPALRSRLSGRGIETLPSPHDPHCVSSRSKNAGEKEKARHRLFDNEQGVTNIKSDSGVGHNRSRTAPENDNSSGVLVSTSFAEYLTSHGISIPDIIVSPDRKSPDRSDRAYEADVSSLYHVESSLHQQSRDKKYKDSVDGDSYREHVQKQHDKPNSRHHTPNVEKLNQRNVQVQSATQHSSSGLKSGVAEALSSPGNVKRNVHSDVSSQHTADHAPVGRPTPIGQNSEIGSTSAKLTPSKGELIQLQPTSKGELVQQHTPVSCVTATSRTQSQSALFSTSQGNGTPVSRFAGLSVTGMSRNQSQSALSSTSQDNGTPVSRVVQPNQHSIPRAFTKESLGRSGVYPSYQMTPVQSPIMKETLHDSNINQGSYIQGLSYPASSQSARRDQELSQLDRCTGGDGDSSREIPSLQINLAGTESNLEEVSTTLNLAKDRLSGHLRHHSAISRAKDLLLSAHAEQVDELQQLCEQECMLIAEVKNGEKDLPEYLDYVEDLLRSKLQCIDTFRDQLDTFSAHTPAASPRSSLEAR